MYSYEKNQFEVLSYERKLKRNDVTNRNKAVLYFDLSFIEFDELKT